MIALLTGTIAYKSLEHVILDVGGVGYRVVVPLSTFYELPDTGTTTLHIHTHVKEDMLALYGFLTSREKEMFILLLGVSGVGPKLAVNILSNIPAADLSDALMNQDVKRLSAIPGIGKKTAERLSLELKDKIARMSPEGARPTQQRVHASDGACLDDVLSALVNLGYKENQARKVLESLEIPPGTHLEDVLKGALKILMK